ncbi:hypothetical protein ES332_D02G047700v1 [Gossypium tomentosum]|uniref:Purple acid phosphatase n=1 Tax=Gossypium tomentosum TaxID=34277 RepID=A0A5D2LT92_GOSTO|nr:hypothetical protein ES332_D02G047700v1 [Gossypium tomentosum]
MGTVPVSVFIVVAFVSVVMRRFSFVNGAAIPSAVDGPFKPVTVPLDKSFRGHAVDLPDNDPRVQRIATGYWEPEQIFVSLSSTHDSVWISWITGLKPNTFYYYQCGDPSIPAMSDVHYFRTMPASGPRSYPGRIAIIGDLGLTYNTTSTIDHLMSNHPNLVLLIGDASYANLYLTNGTGADCYSCAFSDTPIHETYQPRWDYWGRFMQPLVSKVPLMMIEGNHEIEEQIEKKTFAAYSARFAFPSEESGSSSTFYYSFNAGGIHFVMLGGYTDYNKSGDQYQWLKKDLAKVDRKVTPWLVATWHPPWFMPTRGRIECITTTWILAVLFILRLVMVATERKWQLHMLMNPEIAPNHRQLWINLWVGSVHLTSHQGRQVVNSAGIGSLIIVHIEKAALDMESLR